MKGESLMTDTETKTNSIANESMLFDTFASLNVASVKIKIEITDEFFNVNGGDERVVKMNDGEEVHVDDLDIAGDDEGELQERITDALTELVDERIKCLAIYPLKEYRDEEGDFFRGVEECTIMLDIAKRTITVGGTINYETKGNILQPVDPMVFKPDVDEEVA
jgi:hypothetical protein